MARLLRLSKPNPTASPVLVNANRVAYLTKYGPTGTAVHFSSLEKDYIVVREEIETVETEINAALDAL